MSQIEWKTIEIRGFKKLEMSHPCPPRFESLKAGWLDDVEFALAPSGSGVLVRSSARYGVLDVGVNAIRLNAIAAALRAKGWTIGAIDAKQYPDYFVGNDEARASVAGEQVKASNVFNR